MPSETHQIGYDIDTECVAAWVHVLVGRSEEEESGDGTLANFGVDDVEALDVWSAVQGDFVERALGSKSDLYLSDPAITVATAAPAAADFTIGDQRGT